MINEVLASNRLTNLDEDGDSSDWVELYNTGTTPVDLTGFSLTDDPSDLQRWVFPETILAPESYLLVWCSQKDRTTVSEERIIARNSPFPLDPNLVSLDDEWRYLSGGLDDAPPPTDWHSRSFDDSTWERGKPGFGFGRDDDIRTRLTEDVTAIFLRRRFEFVPGQTNLVLQVRYDDGFVAYLNGVRVESRGFPDDEEPTFTSESSRPHSARNAERFDLTRHLDLLIPGENVLSMVVLNSTPTSNDLILYTELGTVHPALHTNFRLNSSGETLILVGADGIGRQRIEIPQQSPDQSFARSPNGSGPFLYHLNPTPIAANEPPAAELPLLVSDTTFTVDRGFYDAPFQVEIATETEGAEIRYSVDGSEPTRTTGLPYDGPITIDRTTVLRARAFKLGHQPTNVDTQTYIFLDDVVTQNVQRAMSDGFPRTWGRTTADYDMDRDVVGPGDRFGGRYAETIRDDLKSLPTMSIVMNVDDLFGERGIYTNSEQRGAAWERSGSIEFFSADGSEEFQESCGIRIQGGFFRQNSASRKHSFRLIFRGRYGATKTLVPTLWRRSSGPIRYDHATCRCQRRILMERCAIDGAVHSG